MLVLTRKKGDSIIAMPGDDVTQSVIFRVLGLDRRYGNMRIGVLAPHNVTILRDEIFVKNYSTDVNKMDFLYQCCVKGNHQYGK